jgi:hypothetical protein
LLEKEFQGAVVDLARHGGWCVHHTRTVRIQGGGYTSPGIDAGFPDLVLAHAEKGVIFAELKTDKGRTSAGQDRWLEVLRQAGAEVYIWRPSQMKLIAERLCPHPTYLRRIK